MVELRDRIATAAQLSSYQVPNAIPLLAVIQVLNRAKANADIDTDQVAALGSLIYPDGGKGALEMIRKARAGEKLLL